MRARSVHEAHATSQKAGHWKDIESIKVSLHDVEFDGTGDSSVELLHLE